MKIEEIKIDSIFPDTKQPRAEFKNIDLLSKSIKKEGLISPIEVTEVEGKYKIIDGERRFRALILLKWKLIPCIIKNNTKDIYIRQLATDFHDLPQTLSQLLYLPFQLIHYLKQTFCFYNYRK